MTQSDRRHQRCRAVAVAVATMLLAVACSSGGESTPAVQSTSTKVEASAASAPSTITASTTTAPLPEVVRPEGPSADLEALPADGQAFIGESVPYSPSRGYVQEEFVASGTATAYAATGELTGNGEWTIEPTEEADYRTRILVRRPADPAAFSGVVVLEWMNVSGGVDAGPEWGSVSEEIIREGHAWVGVSAQRSGVEGGAVLVKVDVPGGENAGQGLKAIDPERYGTLAHPGDAFANDIFTQVARSVRSGEALGDLEAGQLVASGESQSAFALVTYINAVHPLTKAFNGYFVHSRGRSGFPILAPDGGGADIAGSLGGTSTIIRTDLDVPVFGIQAENDVVGAFGSHEARQPDSDGFRLWEVAGTAHADLHLVGEATAGVIDCGAPINDGPMHVVAKAAFHHLVEWITSGTTPPASQLLALDDGETVDVSRDSDGIAEGGVRTPPVDVPAQVLTGVAGPVPSAICFLSGSTNPMEASRLAELYGSSGDYQRRFDEAVEAAIDAGFVLEADRAAIEAYARPELIED